MSSMSSMNSRFVVGVALVLATLAAPASAGAQSARDLYTRALTRERTVRDGGRETTVRQIREVVNAYERVVRRFPASGYSDNALWQAGNLSLLAYQRFGDPADKKAGLRLLNQLKSSYPASSLLERFDETVAEFDTDAPVVPAATPVTRSASAKQDASKDKDATAKDTTSREPAPRTTVTRTAKDSGLKETHGAGGATATSAAVSTNAAGLTLAPVA